MPGSFLVRRRSVALRTRRNGRVVKISCPNCAAAYELDDSRVPPAGLSIKCPKCKNPFTVHRAKGDAAKASARSAVPLPGNGDPTHATAKAPSRPAAKQQAVGGGSAVPLPGLADSPSFDAPAPLPDLDAPGESLDPPIPAGDGF